jgi:hypothetical protein
LSLDSRASDQFARTGRSLFFREENQVAACVAVLFARADSVYKSLPGVDVWDEARDARRWPGGAPVVAHPPCRAWGGLRHMAKPVPGERELTLFALDQVRAWGGVLEHPRRSQLWPEKRLPLGDQIDEFGGYTLQVNQSWWGHKAEKSTLLYICRVRPADIPAVAVQLAAPLYTVGCCGRGGSGVRTKWRPEISHADRERTPPAFAAWLLEIASRAVPAGRGEHGGGAAIGEHGAELSTAAAP